MEKYFNSTIPEITYEMLNPDFWIRHSETSSRIIGCYDKIESFNNKSMSGSHIKDVFDLKIQYTKNEVKDIILSISVPIKKEMYKDGLRLKEEDIKKLETNLDIDKILYNSVVKYGMITYRTVVKSYPTDDKLFDNEEEYIIDRLMESAINICEPVLVFHESYDKEWYFIQSYNCKGWVRKKYLAIGSKKDIEEYAKSKDFLIVTGRRIYTNYNPIEKRTALIPIDMGVKLRLVEKNSIPNEVDDMDVLASYVIYLPVRNEKDGNLELVKTLIPRCADVNIGFLYYTEENIIKQSFKFLGERYGWGGDFFSRDCSSLVLDVLKTMGIYIPRNTSKQSEENLGIVKKMNDLQMNQKKKFLDWLHPGSILYMKGHVMIYLGKYNDEYYVIHDTIGFYVSSICKRKTGDLKYIKANGVTLTPMSIAYTTSGQNYINALIASKIFI
ncbi:SH3 domain-containing protein [Clostridium senegalense]|uniref:Glycoside hydrolase n=1 Tax=Clostridium senegalense TaxID=1465809 RepID=A0A6M0H1W0_9CLOT|nr:SH3 domain-containing protein [Clostridium senegalense]NEU04569.1 hypothetical protein [Clostridium senegalense]